MKILSIVLSLFLIFADIAVVYSSPSYTPILNSIPEESQITTERIRSAGQFGGPLVASYQRKEDASDHTVQREHLEFSKIINSWNNHDYKTAAQDFVAFTIKYPRSPWRQEALLHAGCEAYYNGNYSKARDFFEQVLQPEMNETTVEYQTLRAKAYARLSNVALAEGNLEQAEEYLQRLSLIDSNWRDQVYAAQWLQRISLLTHQNKTTKNCGIKAVEALARATDKTIHKITRTQLTEMGMNLADVIKLGNSSGFSLEGREISVEELSDLPLPAIVYLNSEANDKVGHFWILHEIIDEVLFLEDPQAYRSFSQSIDEFVENWSGVVILPTDSEKTQLPGLALSPKRSRELYGSCCGVRKPEGNLGDPCGGGSFGKPKWCVNPINLNLHTKDTPLWYDPPYGPPVLFTLSYNSLATTTFYEPVGAKWQLNYASYLVVDPSNSVTVFMPDGRRDVYSPDGEGGYEPEPGCYSSLEKLAENHFQLHLPDKTIAEYAIPPGSGSQQPFLVMLSDLHNNSIAFDYDEKMHLTTVTSADGKLFQLDYNQTDQITSITDPFGRSAAFSYNGEVLASITDMGGFTYGFTYDSNIMLTQLQTPDGNYGFAHELPDGVDTDVHHYPPPGTGMWENHRITVTNPAGIKAEYFYNGYDGNSWYVPFGNYIPYQSEQLSNLHAVKDVYETSRNGAGYDYVSNLERRDGSSVFKLFTYELDPDHPNEKEGFRVSDTTGEAYFVAQNEKGRVKTYGKWYEELSTYTRVEYADNGLDPVTLTDDRGTYTFSWTPNHQLDTLTDPLSNSFSYLYDTKGRKVQETDANGRVTQFSYASSGFPKDIIKGNSTALSAIYNERGLLTSLTDSLGTTFSFSYNDLNNPVEIINNGGDTIKFQYSSSIPGLVTSIKYNGIETTYTWDQLERLASITHPTGITYTYNYTPADKVASISRSDGGQTSYSWDDAGRLTQVLYPDNKGHSIHWFNNGQLHARVQTEDGKYLSYKLRRLRDMFYNNQMVVVEKRVCKSGNCDPDTAAGEQAGGLLEMLPSDLISYHYDAHNRLSEVLRRYEAPITGQYSNIELEFSYTATDLLAGYTDPWTESIVEHTYTPSGQLSRSKYSPPGISPIQVDYEYDTFTRLKKVITGHTTYDYSYQDASPLPESLLATGKVKTEFQYTQGGQTKSIEVSRIDDTPQMSFNYKYNSAGYLVSETTDSSFTGDQVLGPHQVSANSADQIVDEDYPMDVNGNLVGWITPDGYTASAQYYPDNRLKTVSYTDSGGQDIQHAFIYSFAGVLAAHKIFINGVVTANEKYLNQNMLPMLIGSLSGAGETRTFTPTSTYTYGRSLGNGVGGLLEVTNGTGTFSAISDRRGDIRSVIGPDSNATGLRSYSPYGLIASQSGDFPIDFAQNSKQYFDDLGIVNYGYRFHLPKLGRWLTRDPIGYKSGMNLYEYDASDPLSYFDPDGREFLTFLAAVGVISLAWMAINTLGTWLNAQIAMPGLRKTSQSKLDLLCPENQFNHSDISQHIDQKTAVGENERKALKDGLELGAGWGSSVLDGVAPGIEIPATVNNVLSNY